MDNAKTLLVVGGAGYIGSVLVGQALAAGYRVRVLDNLIFGGESLLPWISDRHFEFLRGDVRRESDVREAATGAHAVVLLAAIVGDPACAGNPELAVAVNRVGARNAFDAAAIEGVRRFVFASTCSNYGRMDDQTEYVDESSPLRPVSLYAELKVEFERFLLAQSSVNMATTVLRFATAYGLSPRPRFDLTVNEFTKELALGRPLEIYGEHFWRPYCHVEDLSRACLQALQADSEAVAGQAFNVGDSHENYQKSTLVNMILEQLPDARKLVSYVERDEDPRDYRVCFDKIASRLGVSVSRRVRNGIAEIIHAIRSGIISNPDAKRFRNA